MATANEISPWRGLQTAMNSGSYFLLLLSIWNFLTSELAFLRNTHNRDRVDSMFYSTRNYGKRSSKFSQIWLKSNPRPADLTIKTIFKFLIELKTT